LKRFIFFLKFSNKRCNVASFVRRFQTKDETLQQKRKRFIFCLPVSKKRGNVSAKTGIFFMQSGDVPGKFGVIFEKIRVISSKTGHSRTRQPINTEKSAKRRAQRSKRKDQSAGDGAAIVSILKPVRNSGSWMRQVLQRRTFARGRRLPPIPATV